MRSNNTPVIYSVKGASQDWTFTSTVGIRNPKKELDRVYGGKIQNPVLSPLVCRLVDEEDGIKNKRFRRLHLSHSKEKERGNEIIRELSL